MNKHEPNCPMLAGQGAACNCGIPKDPYPPFSDAEIERLDKFYADERSGINANERRLLANIRALKGELAEVRASRDRLMDPVADPRNSDEPENPNNPDPPVYRGPDVKPQWIPQADTRIGELQPGPPVVESKPIMEAHATTCLAHSHSDTTHNEAMQIARSCAGDDGA